MGCMQIPSESACFGCSWDSRGHFQGQFEKVGQYEIMYYYVIDSIVMVVTVRGVPNICMFLLPFDLYIIS